MSPKKPNETETNAEAFNTKCISVRLPQPLFLTIKKNAKDLKIKSSQYVRELIQIGLNVQAVQENSETDEKQNPFDLLYQVQRKILKFTVENNLLSQGHFNKEHIPNDEMDAFFKDCNEQAQTYIDQILPDENKL